MSIRDHLLRMYWRLQRTIAPGLDYSQATYEATIERHGRQATRWLDLGCGRRMLPPWRSDAEAALLGACRTVIGVDADYHALTENASIGIRCQADATALPFAPRAFDLVTANMVVEHLDDPVAQFGEISRVLKPGGLFILHTPNAAGYPTLLARVTPGRLRAGLAHLLDGRGADDVYPTFYRANSSGAIERLALASSFQVVELRYILTTAVFALVLPVAVLELLWLRLLRSERLAHLRTNIIGVLQKTES